MNTNLPADFASKLIDKEIELESDCSITSLTQLVELYRLAIEYYEEIKDPKFWDFQDRLQKILTRPEVLKIMKEVNELYKSDHSIQTRKKRAQTHNPVQILQQKKQTFETSKIKLGSQLEDQINIQITNSAKTATKVVQAQVHRNKTVTEKAVKNILSQERSLEDRISQRKKKVLDVSIDSAYSSNNLSQSFQYGKLMLDSITENSTNSSFLSEFDNEKSLNLSNYQNNDFEEIIELIMEENFAEKTEKISEIKVKYELQINEYLSHGGIFNEVISQMKKKMNEEIAEVTYELDIKRKQSILKAKSEYGKIFKP
jgi:hypothetical protein